MSDNEQVWVPNAQRVRQNILTLASFTDPNQPGWTRRPFTRYYEAARAWLIDQMKAAQLSVHRDAAANIIGRRDGMKPSLPPLVIGSHIDTVSGGGRFDGVVGIVGALEVAHRLLENGVSLRHPLEIVDFTAEEPTDFGVSAVGSRGMVGLLDVDMLETTTPQGQTLHDSLVQAGGRPADLAAEARQWGDAALYLELHIEQGPVLEERDKVLGVVTGIVGIERIRITVRGQPSHAGTTPMHLRHDALAAAAEIVLALESLCREDRDPTVVGTIGQLDVVPNAANVIPAVVTLTAEMRSIAVDELQAVRAALVKRIRQIADYRRMEMMVETITHSPPVNISLALVDLVRHACEAASPRVVCLPSGAGHDANQMAQIAPVGMIFVPSRAGLSHCPEEWTDTESILKGIEALIRAVQMADERAEAL